MIGTTLGHYRILEPLGQGGMGVVYRARDERLEREVALKLLPQGARTDAEARARFRREALALSRLNHPGIATVFDFDRDQERDFLVMELVEGETLAARIARGPIAEAELIAVGAEIADALEAAHDRGVVHRDLKPSNVIVGPRGRVKVLDFGVASLVRPDDDGLATVSLATTLGTVVGTLSYMAPERLLGQPADARSDLYSLGVVLYEMTTRRLPFEASIATALVHAITTTTPAPPRRVRPEITHELEALVLRCIEKDPERRFGSARALEQALRALAAGATRPGSSGGAPAPPPSAEPPSIAVLPLDNLSGDPAEDYFADGMTDALIATLAQTGDLRVISRTSVVRYKGARAPLAQIARELNVSAVVEGAILRAGERVRISAQLIDATSDRHLWARQFQREMTDVLALQEEVAAAIADEVRGKLRPAGAVDEAPSAARAPKRGRAGAGRVHAVNPRAFETYLRGRHLWGKRTALDVRRSIELYNEAIEIDPDFALAYSGLADSYNILADLVAMSSEDAWRHAKATALRALELDEGLAEAHTSMGFLKAFFEWDWPGAEASYRRSLELNPSYATGHHWFSEFLISQGRFDEALAHCLKARELDPLAVVIGSALGDAFYFSRRYDEAIAHLVELRRIEPGFLPVHNDLGRVYTQLGRWEEAFEAFREGARATGGDPDQSAGLGYAFGMAGRRDDARRVLRNLEARRTSGMPVSTHAIAVIHLALGQRDAALEWLETAHAERDRAIVWIKVHPRLDPLRNEPRFQRLLEAMRLDQGVASRSA